MSAMMPGVWRWAPIGFVVRVGCRGPREGFDLWGAVAILATREVRASLAAPGF